MAAGSKPQFVPIDVGSVTVGRSGGSTLRIDESSVSMEHATVRKDGREFLVEDCDSGLGTFVNEIRIRSVRSRLGDRVRFGQAATYRFEAEGLRLEEGGQGLGVVAHRISLAPPGRGQGDDRRLVPTLLRDAHFEIRPGRFVGILGPSGAGKSTLLNCLAGYSSPRQGHLTFDNFRDAYKDLEAYWWLIGHVPQDDVLFVPLTVRENLAYAARLRLGDEVGEGMRDAVLKESLERVRLVEHVDKTVPMLSGGQRKRLSVALELLRRPKLLLLDEPTSGLDPASEAHVMGTLKQLSRQGTTVVATTHLMENIHLFDEVVVLGSIDGAGHLAYVGPPDGLLDHFRCRRFSDLYERLEQGEFTPISSGEAAPLGQAPVAPRPMLRGPVDPASRQLGVVAGRTLRLLSRDRQLAVALVVQPLALAGLVCLTQYNITRGPFTLDFFMIVVAIWLGLNNSARELVRGRRTYVRDRLAGLNWSAYLGALAAIHALIGVAQVAVLVGVTFLLRGVIFQESLQIALRESSMLVFALVLWTAYIGGVGMGFLVSCLARTEGAAVAVLPLLIMPQLLISAVAAGVHNESYTAERPLQPLVLTLSGDRRPQGAAALIDLLSMPCLSRPAALLAERKVVAGYGPLAWIADLCHLSILVLGTWTLTVLAFQRSERLWLRLVNV